MDLTTLFEDSLKIEGYLRLLVEIIALVELGGLPETLVRPA